MKRKRGGGKPPGKQSARDALPGGGAFAREELKRLGPTEIEWVKANERRLRPLARAPRKNAVDSYREKQVADAEEAAARQLYRASAPHSPEGEAISAPTGSVTRSGPSTKGRASATAHGAGYLAEDPRLEEGGVSYRCLGQPGWSPDGPLVALPRGYHIARARAVADWQAAAMYDRALKFYEAVRAYYPRRAMLEEAMMATLQRVASLETYTRPERQDDWTPWQWSSAQRVAATWALVTAAPDREAEPSLLSRLSGLAGAVVSRSALVLDLPPERGPKAAALPTRRVMRLDVCIRGLVVSSSGSRLATTQRTLELLSPSLLALLYEQGPAHTARAAVASVIGRSEAGCHGAVRRGRRLLRVSRPRPWRPCRTCGSGDYWRLPPGDWACLQCHPPDRRRADTYRYVFSSLGTRTAVGAAILADAVRGLNGEDPSWSLPAETAATAPELAATPDTEPPTEG